LRRRPVGDQHRQGRIDDAGTYYWQASYSGDPAIASDLKASFDAGTPTTSAQQHPENGACGWHTGDLTTERQDERPDE
jgi:hypothetical protein